MDSSCPRCGNTGVPLLFGLPVPEARAAADDGALVLGGCFVPEEVTREDELAFWQCPQGHRWLESDSAGWDARLLGVLTRYGYTDPDAT